jgi:UDP-N-acetylmuramate--alanine ligase
VVPALAVADELRARGAEVTFAGTRGRAEAELVPRAGYEIAFLSVSGLDRSNPLRAARSAAQAAVAVPAALRLLRGAGADAVLGGGGYVAGPVGLAAVARRTPLVLTEADSHLGVTNRMLAPFARRVCLAFPVAGLEGKRYRVTGRPVPRAVLEADRAAARSRLGIEPEALAVLVFGGSLGARTLNEAAVAAFGGAFAGTPGAPAVIHVSGRRDHAELAERLRQAGDPHHYKLIEYLDDLGDPLAACDLVIARAGGSVFEIAAAGRPALLVPYPHATADHQSANARWMADGGAAVVVPDDQVSAGRLRAETASLLGDPGRLDRMARASRALARPDAAAEIAAELLDACESRSRHPAPAAGDAPVHEAPADGVARVASRPPAAPDLPWAGRRLHFVGIGGAGMSGLALVARRLGAEVSGCDRSESPYMGELRDVGIEPVVGHDPAHAEPGAEMVVSTAIPADAPELERARALELPVTHRTELLAQAAALRRVIAVSGTHGKTTTTAMTAHLLEACGLRPGFLVGAELRGEANARWGEGEWLVVEADESDRSFLRFSPEVAVVTNVELDHHTTYSSLTDLQSAFAEFLGRVPVGGTAIAWRAADLPAARAGPSTEAEPPSRPRLVTYGIGGEAGLVARDLRRDGMWTSFEVVRDGRAICRARLHVPGDHNVLNALAALAAAEAVGCPIERAAPALEGFRPAGRRFEPRGERAGARIYDDYAHHPTEVAATLAAARALGPRRLIAAFQPHLYSRTLHLHREFGRALAAADEIVVLDVYAARERPEGEFEGVSGWMVAEAAADHAGGRPVWWLPEIDEAAAMLARHLTDGDVLVTLGAGDVDRLAGLLAQDGGDAPP